MGEAVALSVELLDGPAGAEPAILAHGLLGQGSNLRAVGRRLAAHRPVAIVDMRNHGASPWRDEMSYPAMAADLLAVADRLAAPRVRLLGHSMGGKAAMAAALTAPERVSKLLVADIAPIAYDDAENREIVATLQGLDLAGVSRRADVAPMIALIAPDAAMQGFLLQNLALDRDADGSVRARWRPNLDALVAALPAIVGWPDGLVAGGYAGPAHFVAGGRSRYIGAAGRAAIAQWFAQASVEDLPDAGHWVHAEAPERFGEIVDARLGAD